MQKEEIYALLDEKKVSYQKVEHKAVFTMTEIDEISLPYPEREAKNLFVCDDKKRNYYLITVKSDKRVDLKNFRKQEGLRPLHLASVLDLEKMLKLTPGSVTPFGLLQDEKHEVKWFLDEDFFDDSSLIGVHPNQNTATVFLKVQDLVMIMELAGVSYKIVKV